MKKHTCSLIIITLISAVVVFFATHIWSTWEGGGVNAANIGRLANKIITAILTGTGIVLLGNIFVYPKLKTAYSVFMYVLTIVITVVNVFCLQKFSLLISPTMFDIIADTNDAAEITGFFKTYFDLSSVILLASALVVGVGLWMSEEKLQKFFTEYKKVTAAIIIIPAVISYALVGKVAGDAASSPIVAAFKAIKDPIKISIMLAKMSADKTNRVELISADKHLPDNFIFIIGESESKHFMGMYKSRYNSTPLCQRLIDSGNMFAFRDTISMKSSTALVMKPLLSFINNETENQDISKFDPIIDVFKKVGYQCFWLSNQEKITKSLSYATYVSTRCDYKTFTAKSTGQVEWQPWLCTVDGVMLPPFENYLNKEAKAKDKNMFVLHLMGSHIQYKDRYPKEFAKFVPEDVLEEGFDKHQKTITAAYLNSILYTDYFINEIISHFKDKDAVLVYASDHAEEMWQTGFQGHGPTNVSKPMVEIPMCIWVSDLYKERRPEIVSQIEKSLDNPYMTDDLVHTMLDLAGIVTKQYDPTRSVINGQFQTRDRKINGIKYEDLRPKNK